MVNQTRISKFINDLALHSALYTFFTLNSKLSNLNSMLSTLSSPPASACHTLNQEG